MCNFTKYSLINQGSLQLVINKFPKSVNLFLIDLRNKVNYVTLKKI